MRKLFSSDEEPSSGCIKITKRFEAEGIIAYGSSSVVYNGKDLHKHDNVAVKLEPAEANQCLLLRESQVYKLLNGSPGFASLRWYGTEKNYNVLVLDLLGPSLEDLFIFCFRKFSLPTVLKLAEQMINRLAFLHSKGFVHRDIKPQNFVMGSGKSANTVHLIDFGLAKKYINLRTKDHIQYREDKFLVGTARFASIYSHYGIEQSRRDDLESLAYVLLYFNKGSLPWQGIKAMSKKQKYEMICEKKMSISVEELCKGLPVEFVFYLNYCRQLAFNAEPCYDYVRNSFVSLFRRITSSKDEFFYDWLTLAEEK